MDKRVNNDVDDGNWMDELVDVPGGESISNNNIGNPVIEEPVESTVQVYEANLERLVDIPLLRHQPERPPVNIQIHITNQDQWIRDNMRGSSELVGVYMVELIMR